MPAIANGTIGASVRSAMIAQPVRNGPSRPGGPLTVPSGICTKTAPFATTARAEATCCVDADPAAPDRQQAAEPVDERLAPARGEGRRAAAEEPGARLGRERVHHHERVHPARGAPPRRGGSRRPAGVPGPWPGSGTGRRRRRRSGRPGAGPGTGGMPWPRAVGRARRGPRRRRRGRRPMPRARPGPAAGAAGPPRAVRPGRSRQAVAATASGSASSASSVGVRLDRVGRRAPQVAPSGFVGGSSSG